MVFSSVATISAKAARCALPIISYSADAGGSTPPAALFCKVEITMNILGYLALTVAFGMPALAHAATSTVTTPTPMTTAAPRLASTEWRVDCNNDGTHLDCETVDRVVQPTGQTVLSVTMHPVNGGKQALAVVELPLGLPLNVPARMAVDQGPLISLAYNTCVAEGCIASTVLSEAEFAKALQGRTLKVSFAVTSDKTATLALPLRGLAVAFDYMTMTEPR
jgi:invasion protein IalB